MSDHESTFEVQRIRNLITNFGWEITKQKIQEDEITLTIVKERSVPLPDIDVGAS